MREEELSSRAQTIQLLLMDVDGVLTDGKLLFVPMPDGSVVEAKAFDVNDGAGIGFARRTGIKTGFLSGRSSPAASRRAEEMHIDFVHLGLGRTKLPAFEEILTQTGIPKEHCCYVGDDVQDLPILSRVGLPVATANARPEVLAQAAYVTKARGGNGAIREVVELILKAQGKWDALLAEFR